MIEINILRKVLLDQDFQINELDIDKTKAITEILKEMKLRNNFMNLCKSAEIKDHAPLRKKEFIIKNIYIKNISLKLTEQRVKHVFIKGVPLSNSFYKNPSDRIYTDADILIDLKDYKKFYKFLDANNLKHSFNYKYLDRIGYTRSALEVIDTEVNLDFHFKITESFKKNDCRLSKYSLKNYTVLDDLPVPSNELLLTICLYNALKKDQLKSGPIYLVDSERIIKKGVNEDYLSTILSDFNLTNFYKETICLIENLKKGVETREQTNFIVGLFKNEGKRSFIPSKRNILTQVMHILDPEPYINYVGGDLKANHFLELLRNKLKRAKKRF